ncbi:hypothetical protein M513_08908, partial [Trichuris suis]
SSSVHLRELYVYLDFFCFCRNTNELSINTNIPFRQPSSHRRSQQPSVRCPPPFIVPSAGSVQVEQPLADRTYFRQQLRVMWHGERSPALFTSTPPAWLLPSWVNPSLAKADPGVMKTMWRSDMKNYHQEACSTEIIAITMVHSNSEIAQIS